jgi:hypothetical protein
MWPPLPEVAPDVDGMLAADAELRREARAAIAAKPKGTPKPTPSPKGPKNPRPTGPIRFAIMPAERRVVTASGKPIARIRTADPFLRRRPRSWPAARHRRKLVGQLGGLKLVEPHRAAEERGCGVIT